ncbi:MAG: hypothetical protein CL878_07210 [Dehalococcoidia bacterium]|nr:hypothetical protein [Dehalococcoidia bacterium]
MLYLITQTHAAEACPVDAGGKEILYEDPDQVEGLKVVAAYGAFPEHTLYFVVEADDYSAIDRFLRPGLNRCTCTITPVSQFLGE